ncbi:MAG: hypothetical protein FJZ08_00760 [Candidatus Omnitrophica bacterium]|nr:hypothetical protein [Candidatus Omnitrophota bacterium]
MKFEQLRKTVKDVGFQTSRADNENYLELVIVKDNLEELILRLENLFGPPPESALFAGTEGDKRIWRDY